MKKTKGLFLTGFILVLCMVVIIPASHTRQPQGGKVVVRFWHAMAGPLGEVMKRMIKEFNEKHPQVYVKEEFMGSYSTLSQKTLASIVAKNNPELAQAYESWTAQLVDGDAIVPLDKFINNPEYGLTKAQYADLLPVFIKNNTFVNPRDKKKYLYSLPFNKSSPVLYYNKDMFKAAGLDPAKPPTTHAEFIEYAKKLTKDFNNDGNIDQYGYTTIGSAWDFGNVLYQKGGRFLDETETKVAFNSKEGAEALQFFLDLIDKHKVAYRTSGFNNQTDFTAGKVAMITGSCVSREFMKDQITFNWGTAQLPGDKRKAVVVYGTNICIFKNTTEVKQRWAWEFIKWFTSTENTARWAAETSYLPVRASALKSSRLQEHFKKEPDAKAAIDQLAWAEYEPSSAGWFRSRDYLIGAIDETLLKKATAKEALDKVAVKVQREIDKALKK